MLELRQKSPSFRKLTLSINNIFCFQNRIEFGTHQPENAVFMLLAVVSLDCATFLVDVWDPLKCSEKKPSTALCMNILWNELVNSSSTAPSGRVRNGWKYASVCNPHPPVGLMWIFSTSVRTSAKVSDLSHWECISLGAWICIFYRRFMLTSFHPSLKVAHTVT